MALTAHAQAITRVNTTPAGAQATGLEYSPERSIDVSADGRFTAFVEPAALIPGGTGVYVKDRATGAVECISLTTAGIGALGNCPSMSADGRFVAFSSAVANLVTGDANSVSDIFVRDRQTATTTRISVSSAGSEAIGGSDMPSMSADGRYVAFRSTAINLDPGDNNPALDIYVHDRVTGTTSLVSVLPSGLAGGGNYPFISGNGRIVAFHSANAGLDPAHPGPTNAIFVRDLVLGTTERASFDASGIASAGTFFNGLAELYYGCGGLSWDGRFVTYYTIVGTGNIVRRDRVTGAVDVVDSNVFYDVAGGSISDDGRFVVFNTHAGLVAGDNNGEGDIHVRDFELGTLRRISIPVPNIASSWPECGDSVISGDGTTVVFSSWAINLVVGDTNNKLDYFAHDMHAVAPTAYCTAGVSAQGCTATLSTSGAPSGSAGSGFVITASGVDGQRSALLLYGIDGRAANPWGASTMCVAPPRQRTTLQSSAGTPGQCNGSLTLDWNAYIATHPAALGSPFVALTPTVAQAWIRDPQSTKRSVLSNAVEFYTCP